MKYDIVKVVNYHLVAQIGIFEDMVKTSIYFVNMATRDGSRISGIVNIDQYPKYKDEDGYNKLPIKISGVRILEYNKYGNDEREESNLTCVKLTLKQCEYLYDVLLGRCDPCDTWKLDV